MAATKGRLIRGKVARKITGRELAINRGSDSGVEVGMLVQVLDTRAEDIIDPDTGENLGSIRRIKKSLNITKVTDKLSLARADRTGIGAIGAMFEPDNVRDELGEVGVGDPVEIWMPEDKATGASAGTVAKKVPKQ